jgi:hypothetical protein
MDPSGEQIKEALLAKVRIHSDPSEEGATRRPPLEADELLVLVERLNHPFAPSSAARRDLATMGPRKFDQIAAELQEKGLVEEVRLRLRAGRGRPMTFFWATNGGREIIGLGDRGVETFFHLYARKMALPTTLTDGGFKVATEYPLSNGHRVDVVATKGSEERRAYEVETGWSNVVENLQAIVSATESFDSITVVTPVGEDHRIGQRINKGLDEKIRSLVAVCTIANFVK